MDVTLISVCTHVTPLKKQTIPRLELDALRIGINLATTISEESDIEVRRVVFWTYSIICKYWLTQPSRRYKDYVAHRIVDLLEKTESLAQKGLAVEVRYVRSEMNAADIGTRWAMLRDLDFDSAWQRGPNFLRKPENEWPEEPGKRVNDDPSEGRKFVNAGVACVNAGDKRAIDFQRYSTLWKAKGDSGLCSTLCLEIQGTTF